VFARQTARHEANATATPEQAFQRLYAQGAQPWWLGPCLQRPLITTLGLGLATGITLCSGQLLAAAAGLLRASLSLFAGSATALAQALTW
jgi:hypothetical protein